LKLQAWILKSFWIVNLFSPAKTSIGNIISRMTKYFMLPPLLMKFVKHIKYSPLKFFSLWRPPAFFYPLYLTSFVLRAFYAQLTLCRSKGRWKLTKLNRTGLLYTHEGPRSFFHHNVSLLYAASARQLFSVNILLSLSSAKITLISFITTAQRASFFFMIFCLFS
jgi:hypothetical protein